MAVRIDSCESEFARRERLAHLIRLARRSIRPDAAVLGSFRRLDNRIGRAVTQDEVAEACAISRQWYGSLEQGAPIRMSVAVLERIANVLMLDPRRRGEVFALAFPELTCLPKDEGIDEVVETNERLPVVKAIAARLGSATSEREALAITADALSMLLQRLDMQVARGASHLVAAAE